MQLIDEQDDLPVAAFHILQHGLQTLFKLAPVLGSRHQRAHVQGENLLILQALGHVAPHDPLRKALHHGGLAHAGFADQDRVILGLSGQDTDHVADLRVPADHRIQLLVSGLLHQILAVFFQRIIGGLRVVAGHPLVSPHGGKRLQKPLSGDAVLVPDGLDLLIGMTDHGQEQMLHGNILVSHLLRLVLRRGQNHVQILAHIDLAALYLHALLNGFLCSVYKMLLLNPHFLDQL